MIYNIEIRYTLSLCMHNMSYEHEEITALHSANKTITQKNKTYVEDLLPWENHLDCYQYKIRKGTATPEYKKEEKTMLKFHVNVFKRRQMDGRPRHMSKWT